MRRRQRFFDRWNPCQPGFVAGGIPDTRRAPHPVGKPLHNTNSFFLRYLVPSKVVAIPLGMIVPSITKAAGGQISVAPGTRVTALIGYDHQRSTSCLAAWCIGLLSTILTHRCHSTDGAKTPPTAWSLTSVMRPSYPYCG